MTIKSVRWPLCQCGKCWIDRNGGWRGWEGREETYVTLLAINQFWFASWTNDEKWLHILD